MIYLKQGENKVGLIYHNS